MSHGAAELSDALQGRYTIERELGRGGMATVYLAEDLKLHRRVALKLLHPELGAALGRERFLREIDIASRLSHPHILPVYDSGDAGGRLFYAMPFVEGESLRQRLQWEPQLPVEETVAIVRAAAAALACAHKAGIIHRDIKPENILLARDPGGGPPHVLVADFGIARAVDVAAGERLTETGLALGTPSYMSPEQAGSSNRIDGRSDVYALGCVAYEMLAGAPPFTGPTAQAILSRHAVDPVPPLRTVRSTVPEAVASAIERALAKVPADRFITADAFAEALVADDGQPLRLQRSLLPRRAGLLLGACAAAAAAGAGTWMVREFRSSPVAPSAATIAVLPFSSGDADTSLTRLGRDLAVTISASLDGVGGVKAADRLLVATETAHKGSLSPADGAALARRLGARSVLRGTLVRAGDNVRLDAGLYDAANLAPLANGISFTGHRDSIGLLTDSVAWALLRRIWQRGEPPSPSLAAVTTRSLPALRAFLDGERALGANQWEEARLAFRTAIAADSTFWLADFRYALAQFWLLQPVLEPEIVQGLRDHRQLLPERERSLAEAFLTSGDSTDLRIERYRQVTERFPDYWPGWFLYGDMLFHFGSERGYDWTAAVEAFQRAVALNPRLVPALEHIHQAAFGKDQAEAAWAAARLAEYGVPPPEDLLSRLLVRVDRAGGRIPPELEGLADSLAARMVANDENLLQSGSLGLTVLQNGLPAVQLQLNERILKSSRLSSQVRTALQAADAWAWAARGRWDSALTIIERAATQHPGILGPTKYAPAGLAPVGGPLLAVESYELAVIGAWLGATAPALADQRRARAVSALAQLADEEPRRDGLGRMAWLDGILGFVRGDRQAIRAARRDASRSGYYQVPLVDRSLSAFDHALGGERRRAGRELAELDRECLDHIESCNLVTPHIAVHRLAAAQWLAEAGDVEQARRLLRWHDAEATYPGALYTLVYTLGAPTYLARARLDDAGGDRHRARQHYRQFLRRYDQPMPSQAHLVEEAKAALLRLGGEP
jgi:serine/threonine-protein kinase